MLFTSKISSQEVFSVTPRICLASCALMAFPALRTAFCIASCATPVLDASAKRHFMSMIGILHYITLYDTLDLTTELLYIYTREIEQICFEKHTTCSSSSKMQLIKNLSTEKKISIRESKPSLDSCSNHLMPIYT